MNFKELSIIIYILECENPTKENIFKIHSSKWPKRQTFQHNTRVADIVRHSWTTRRLKLLVSSGENRLCLLCPKVHPEKLISYLLRTFLSESDVDGRRYIKVWVSLCQMCSLHASNRSVKTPIPITRLILRPCVV